MAKLAFRRPGNNSGKKQLPRNVYRRAEKPETTSATTIGLEDKHQAGIQVLKSAGVLGTARILPPQKSPREQGYRSLFKLAVRPARNQQLELQANQPEPANSEELVNRFAIGLFAPGTHEVLDVDDYPQHAEPLRHLLFDLRRELNASPLTPYDEDKHSGDLRYIVARAAHLTGELMVTFVVTKSLKHECKAIVQRLIRLGHKINSAHMNINPDSGNAIFGRETERIAGSDHIRERACDLDFAVGPTSFYQINPWQAINLYRRVEQIAGPAHASSATAPQTSLNKPIAWDLYCGIGQISLVLARQGYQVFGIEENPQAIADAEGNARKNRLADKASFLAARVEDATPLIPLWARTPDLIVVNPSRRGLAEATRHHLTELLRSHPLTRLIYVSCEVSSLARDLQELVRSGFHLRQVEAFDMFPQTDNMEWLVVLTR